MMTPQNAPARFYVSASILVTVVIAMADPYSQHAEAMSKDGAGGFLAMVLLGGLAVAGLLDVAINDWMPPRLCWQFPHRHIIYMAMAMGQVGLTLVIAQSGDIRPVILRYLLDAFVSVYIAGAGVKSHYSQRMSRATEHDR
jgi:hypothetical protein